MKIAVLADIHANWVALQRVAEDIQAWGPDHVIVAGDTVNRGPRPVECLRFVQEKQRQEGWQVLRGNHEDYVIHQSHPDAPREGPLFHVHQASRWTYQQLNRDVSALVAMPFKQTLRDPDGGEVRVVHASMRGNRDGIYPETRDEELYAKLGLGVGSPAPSVFCVGHTHRSLIRRLADTLVINAGSAGLPFDGDPRPAYARLAYHQSGWQAEIVRLEYDLGQAIQDFHDSGYLEGGGPLVDLVLIELSTARSMLYYWSTEYQERCGRGEISMHDSVKAFKRRLDDS